MRQSLSLKFFEVLLKKIKGGLVNMRIRRRIVSKEDFGGDLINHYSSLSPLDWLGIVAQKALEKETSLS